MKKTMTINNMQEILGKFEMLETEEKNTVIDILEKITEALKMSTNIITDAKNLTIAEVYPSAFEDIKTAEEEERKAFKAIRRLTFYNASCMTWDQREYYEKAEPKVTPTKEEAEILYQQLFKAAGYRDVAEIKALSKAKADEYTGGNLELEINRRQKTTYTCIPQHRDSNRCYCIFHRVRGNKRQYTN